jgi:hypothetical protein
MEESAESSPQKTPAWSKQKYLKEEKIPSINEIIELFSQISRPRDRCLLIMTYLTAGRIKEVIKKEGRTSIKKNDFKIIQEDFKDILLIDLRNEKNRDRKRKEIPVPLDIKENAILWNMMLEYINSLGNEDELFHISYQKAYEIIIKYTGWNPHWIRHLRLTHLVTVYGYKEFQLVRYAGWSDSRPAKNYVEMSWKDLLY